MFDLTPDAVDDFIQRDDTVARQQLRAASRRSFYFHTKGVMSFYFRPNRMGVDEYKERQDWIQWVLVEARRGLLQDPRAHMKSAGSTVAAPPWLAIQRPDPRYDAESEVIRANAFLAAHPHLRGVDSRLIVLSDSAAVAGDWVDLSKAQWEQNAFLRWLWPEYVWDNPKANPACRRWSAEAYFLPGRTNPSLRDGFLRAGGIGSKEQGGRTEGMFIEDIVGEQSYNSEPELEKRKRFMTTITNLLEDNDYKSPTGGFVFVNGNRWCLGDVNSFIIDTMPHYEVWSRMAYRCVVHGAGNCGRQRSDEVKAPEDRCAPSSEPLWKSLYPDAASLQRVALDKGPVVFAAQWLNDPTAVNDLDANLIVPAVIDYVDVDGEPTWAVVFGEGGQAETIPLAALTTHVLSIDPASSRAASAARTAVSWLALHRKTRRRFLIESACDRFSPGKVPGVVIDMYQRVVARAGVRPRVLCEKVATQDYVGVAVAQEARARGIRFPGVVMVDVPRHEGSKEDKQRRRYGHLLENRLLVASASAVMLWHETRHFPSGTKDLIDTIVQAEDIFQGISPGTGDAANRRARDARRRDRLRASTTAGVPVV